MSFDLTIFGDAAPFLRMSDEKRMEIMAKQIAMTKTVGGAKAVWCPTPENSELQYTKGKLAEAKNGLVFVVRDDNGQKVKMSEDDVQECNPPKYYQCEDMANLTFLNEASVIDVLRTRYEQFLIYTYSGLFCVTVNPYKMLPVYQPYVIDAFRGRKVTSLKQYIQSSKMTHPMTHP